ncbi:hypothetical protein SPRG_03535 [Saprolegnia parasitica CBS 223.65]|uniref:RING-type domain-containing protein n=1 Tax=Saprolegnia parasitica (strain CBS 223.65) TaxID=695850 RepID=A0A067CQV5_SAPPC|nr:hypothetical protein SPRG_03535 [Saprolegnia parasitica CBS 223.65]KDO31615.1 hypothetical protein SPRG_03535 [Saprolegnia parasitica CBS 223.65]|eukprot:XP_012197505.1 hypothetical protein SPRG_03535 [Saprolegnia parasitica CBS 223.65]
MELEEEHAKVLQKRDGWVQEVSHTGVIQYRHEESGHCQAHPPDDWTNLPLDADTTLPPIDDLVSSRRRLSEDEQPIPELRNLPLACAMSEKEKHIKFEALRRQSQSMTTDYISDVERYNSAKPFSRRPDKTFDPEARCIMCKTHKIHMVFFPCEHKCVCNKCLEYHPPVTKIAGKGAHWPHACPVCYRDVTIMFENTGFEVDHYWKLDEVPHLSNSFVTTFKRAGSRLHTTPNMVFPALDELCAHEDPTTTNRPNEPGSSHVATTARRAPPRLREKTKTCCVM